MIVALVAVEKTSLSFDKLFEYLIPESLSLNARFILFIALKTIQIPSIIPNIDAIDEPNIIITRPTSKHREPSIKLKS